MRANKGLNVLIVDDHDTTRKTIRTMLEDFGFSCAEAENGLVAYDYCVQNRKPDLIMLDWHMPVMPGIDFMKKLHAAHFSFTPPVIFCTTQSQKSFIELGLCAGAVDYMIKPFEKAALRTKLMALGFLDPDED